MERVDLIRHLETADCVSLREGGRHTVYVNPKAEKVSTVPHRRKINEFLPLKICVELTLSKPAGQQEG